MLTTPILLMVFNRPETTRRILKKIAEVEPLQLFVAADGPRDKNPEDLLNCFNTREIIDTGIYWRCEVHKLYRDKNLGCGIAVSEAITWFFKSVDKGIILEDDTEPNSDFFDYCSTLLQYYKDDSEILHISGSNYAKTCSYHCSYYFSRIPFIWGWATWRRAWEKYDFSYKYLPIEKKKEILNFTFSNKEVVTYWSKVLNDFHLLEKSYTWDYQWFLTIWIHKGLVIQPKRNLTTNIGFDINATHTINANHPLSRVKAQGFKITKYCKSKVVNDKYEKQNFQKYFYPKPHLYFVRKAIFFLRRIKHLLYRSLSKKRSSSNVSL